MFKCTWKDCDEIAASCHSIEQHIRTQHLGRRVVNSESESDSDDDHEEEFYWTEVEVNTATWVDPNDNRTTSSPAPAAQPNPYNASTSLRPLQQHTTTTLVTPSVAMTPPSPVSTLQYISSTRSLHQHQQLPVVSSSLRENSQHLPIAFVSSPPTLSHMDMARPPHEDPDYRRQLGFSTSVLSSSWPKSSSYLASNRGRSRAGATTKAPSGRGKRNGESRKCRKVYGMEQKDQWCTQCKWKKACSRFGE